MTGFTKVDNEILEVMATVKLSPTQYRLLFVIWRQTYGFNRNSHTFSLTFFEKATGCDKRSIQRDLNRLVEYKVIFQEVQNGIGRVIEFNRNFDDWLNLTTPTIGETANGKTTNGEITNGHSANVTIGETANPTIGRTTNATIGETANQERKVKEIYKEKGKEREPSSPASTNVSLCFQFFESNIGMLSPIHREEMLHYFDDFGGDGEVLIEAMKIACDRSKKNFGFVKWLLNQWLNANAKTIDAVKAYEVSQVNKYQPRNQKAQRSIFEQGEASRRRQKAGEESMTEESRRELEKMVEEMPY